MFVYKLLTYENDNKSLKKFTERNNITRDFEKRVVTYLNCARVLKRSVESGIYVAFCFCYTVSAALMPAGRYAKDMKPLEHVTKPRSRAI